MSSDNSILVIAGEASGDAHAASLLRELKSFRPGLHVFGVGGDALLRQGAELMVHASETTVTGFVEVARRYRFLRGVFNSVLERVRRQKPSLAILVDYPGFNLRLAPLLRREGIPVLYYIAPQVWAWKEGRVKILRESVDELVVLFPFEVQYFARHGITAHFFGHPLVNRLEEEKEERRAKASALKGDDRRPIIAYLPGSRPNEIRRHVPVLSDTAALLGERYRHIVARAETISPDELRALLPPKSSVELHDDAKVVLQAADAGIIKSGTSTLEAALIGVPYGVIYKTSFLSYRIAKTLAGVDSIAMVNILEGRPVVREYLQERCTPSQLADEVRRLLQRTEERKDMCETFDRLRHELYVPDTYRQTAAFIAERFLGG